MLDVGAVKAIAVFSAISGLTVDEFAARARLLEPSERRTPNK
jgi:hypothetical protein